MRRLDFRSAKLRTLAKLAGNKNAAAQLQKLERLVYAVERREDALLYLPSLLLAAATQLVLTVDRWRTKHQKDFMEWLDAWAEFEALNAVACYAYENPDDIFPDLVDGAARFEAQGLSHPLIPHSVSIRNDVSLGQAAAFNMVSGSNMAGKSTFLRALGTNAILASAGGPIRAVNARISVFNICASISIADSLFEGKSKFLAEVERLRETIHCASAGKPVLFLIDEILSGTNSGDRRMVARSVIEALVAAGAVGALSTHDLALTDIADTAGLRGVNVHMESENPEDPLDFDYLVKPGVSLQANALAIVRMMGIHP
jgi:DNA mismatch repair ATPase MutS